MDNQSINLNKRIFSEEHRKKLSFALIGNKRWLGKKHKNNSKKRIGEANRKRIWKKESKEKLRKCLLGTIMSKEIKEKISQTTKGTRLNDTNPAWKGDKVGIAALHNWAKRRIKKPTFCMNCLERKPYDLANISQKYKRDIFDWEWLCRKCHMTKDGRIKNLFYNHSKIERIII